MSAKIYLPNGYAVEGESPDDLRMALSVLGITLPNTESAAIGIPASSKLKAPSNERPGAVPESIAEKLVALYDRLKSNDQKAALQILAENPDGMMDDELRIAVGLATKPALGGLMSGLTKNAKSVGLRFEKHVIIKQKRRGLDSRPYYYYRLTPELRDLVRERIGESGGQVVMDAALGNSVSQ